MSKVYTNLYDGAYFGEVALLMDGKRTASIKTVYQCDILGLHRKDLNIVLEDFPKVKMSILQSAAAANYKMDKQVSSRGLARKLKKELADTAERTRKSFRDAQEAGSILEEVKQIAELEAEKEEDRTTSTNSLG
eukprot:g4334.t1